MAGTMADRAGLQRLAADRITGQAGRTAAVDIAAVADPVVEEVAEAAVPVVAAPEAEVAEAVDILDNRVIWAEAQRFGPSSIFRTVSLP